MFISQIELAEFCIYAYFRLANRFASVKVYRGATLEEDARSSIPHIV